MTRQSSTNGVKTVTKRKCPACSSASVPGGTKRGLDGQMWLSNMMSNGAYRWQRVSKAKPKPSKAGRPAVTRQTKKGQAVTQQQNIKDCALEAKRRLDYACKEVQKWKKCGDKSWRMEKLLLLANQCLDCNGRDPIRCQWQQTNVQQRMNMRELAKTKAKQDRFADLLGGGL